MNMVNIGDKFGKLTVIENSRTRIKNSYYYKVRCDCGTEAYKLPIELLYKNREFQCEKCAQKERSLQTTCKAC